MNAAILGNSVNATQSIQMLFYKFNALDEYLLSHDLGSFAEYLEESQKR
jgi:hypothetical protein